VCCVRLGSSESYRCFPNKTCLWACDKTITVKGLALCARGVCVSVLVCERGKGWGRAGMRRRMGGLLSTETVHNLNKWSV
jgi:hypothetical protein